MKVTDFEVASVLRGGSMEDVNKDHVIVFISMSLEGIFGRLEAGISSRRVLGGRRDYSREWNRGVSVEF